MREQSGQKGKRGEGGSVEKRRNKPRSGEAIRKPIRMKIKLERNPATRTRETRNETRKKTKDPTHLILSLTRASSTRFHSVPALPRADRALANLGRIRVGRVLPTRTVLPLRHVVVLPTLARVLPHEALHGGVEEVVGGGCEDGGGREVGCRDALDAVLAGGAAADDEVAEMAKKREWAEWLEKVVAHPMPVYPAEVIGGEDVGMSGRHGPISQTHPSSVRVTQNPSLLEICPPFFAPENSRTAGPDDRMLILIFVSPQNNLNLLWILLIEMKGEDS
ncbi:hypothetical protein B0H14DRAFT_3652103 [Mycena olivaceomarginata]|nr:hypothetical protein B0H14DRAFT_3652103 [Mycena olivaceomarginata]